MFWADVISAVIMLFLIVCIAACGVTPQDRPSSSQDRLFERAPDRRRARTWPEIWGYSHDTGGPLPARRATGRKRRTD